MFAVAAFAACNAVFGLEPTAGDEDGDGIVDSEDNCPSVPNPDQFDSDGDGVGDACASCATPTGIDVDRDGYDDGCDRCLGPGPTGVDIDEDGIDDGCDTCINGVGTLGVDSNADGIDDGCEMCPDGVAGPDSDGDLLPDRCDSCNLGPPHDEDRDGIDDACDNCPGIPNKDQAANGADGDDLGNACDPNDLDNHTRVLFDPFLIDRPSEWQRVDPGWTVGDDIARATGNTTRLTTGIVQSSFSVSAQLARSPIGAGAAAGVLVVDPSDPNASVQCAVTEEGRVTLDVARPVGPAQHLESMETGDVTLPVVIVLKAAPLADLSPRFRCTASFGGNPPIEPPSPFQFGSTWRAGLILTAGDVSVRWFVAVTGP
jgi:hypothetical protein